MVITTVAYSYRSSSWPSAKSATTSFDSSQNSVISLITTIFVVVLFGSVPSLSDLENGLGAIYVAVWPGTSSWINCSIKAQWLIPCAMMQMLNGFGLRAWASLCWLYGLVNGQARALVWLLMIYCIAWYLDSSCGKITWCWWLSDSSGQWSGLVAHTNGGPAAISRYLGHK